ncbi:MAG: diguanylate cyclase [Bacillota bacterium]
MDLINNRYKIIAAIKEDFSNSLFLVSDQINENKRAALKIINPELVSPKAIEYMKKEFITLSTLSHPNLMEIYSFGIINSIDGNNITTKQYFCTYEHLNGKNIFSAAAAMSFDGIISLILQVCNALNYLHRRGYTYRNLDIKNVIVTENNNTPLVKLVGIAGNEEIEKAVLRLRKISHQFRAPEVLRYDNTNNLSDLYSLGVLIFYLITGKNPNRNNFSSVWSQYRNSVLSKSTIRGNIDIHRFISLIDKLTSSNPVERYQDVCDVIKEIEEMRCKKGICIEKRPFEKIITKTKLIGREEYLKQLNSWKDEALRGACNQKIICLSGEAGIGKTRLLNEFCFSLSFDKVKVFKGISSESEGNTYEPVLQILKQIINVVPAEILEKYKPELVKVLPDEKSLKGVIPSPALPDDKEGLRLKVRIASLISNVLEKQPSVIILDNAQWTDEATLELLDYLISIKKQFPLSIIISYRKDQMEKNRFRLDFINKWKQMDVVNDVTLPSFDFEETSEFIKSLLGIKNSPTAFCTEIFRYTEGNPGFIIDAITALFKEEKLYVDSSGQWSTDFDDDADYSRLYIPTSIHEAVLKHIKTLNEDCYTILELISVFNMPVSFEVLERLAFVNRHRVKDILMELISHQIIEQKLADWGYTYDFHSRNIKNEVYKKIDSLRKKDFHKKCALVLEEMYNSEDRINKDELIYHFTKAGEKEKALQLIIESADKMLKLHINAQTMAYLKKGRQISREISSVKDTIRILLMMGELYRKKGENKKAFECYNEVLKYAQESDDRFTIAKVKEMMGALYTRKNDFDKALVILNESLVLSKEIGFAEGYLESVRRICWVYIFKRKNSEAIDMINRVLGEYSDDAYSFYHASLFNVLGTHYLELSNINEALNCYNKSIELFDKNGENVEIAYPLNNIATVFAEFLNDNTKAREYFERSLKINIANNLVEGISSCYDNLGETCRLEDNYAQALEYYFKCEELAGESELNALLFTVYKNILLAYLELDEYYKSYDYLLKSNNEIERNPDRGIDLQIFYEYAARFYYEIGSFEEAKSLASKGMAACKKSGLQESIWCQSVLILAEFYISSDNKCSPHLSLFDSAQNILRSHENNTMIKDRREAIHRFTEALADAGDTESALKLLDESLKLSSRINTERLEIEYLYLYGSCIGGYEGIEIIERALQLNEKYQSVRFEWKGYKAIGDIYFSLKEKKSSATYYIKALDVLYKLVQKVPRDYYESFLYSHSRNIPRERLLSIKANHLREQGFSIKKQITKKTSKNVSLLKFYFSGINYESIFYEGKNNHVQNSINEQNSIFLRDSIDKIRNVLINTSGDHLKHLKLIIDTACNLTLAETGYILRYNDKNELDVFASRENNWESRHYQYIIEHTSENDEGIFVADTFDKKVGNASIILPGDTKAVICIPICSLDSGEKYSINKRKASDKADYDIKGYIYLSTRNIFNKFSWNSLEAVKILAKQAYLHMENYNLKIISSVDKLTGVYTRKYFENVIEILLKKAHREKSPLSVIMVDIDKFKSINDNYGHQKGDEILSSVGKILLDNIRPMDICCRYGGEEFVIILPDTNISEAEAMAERLRNTVEKSRLMGQGSTLTISLGLSSYPKHGEWRDELIGKADQALYHAKESGRNRCSVWNTKMRKLSKRMDKLAGIITGNVVQDQRNVLAMLEIIRLTNESLPQEDRIYKILGTIIDIFESECGILTACSGPNNKHVKTYARKSTVSDWVNEESYNRKIIDKALKSKSGSYMVDWDNVNIIDPETGEPILHSILVEPIIKGKNVIGVLYLSCPISRKEYGFNELNFLGVIANIIAGILPGK